MRNCSEPANHQVIFARAFLRISFVRVFSEEVFAHRPATAANFIVGMQTYSSQRKDRQHLPDCRRIKPPQARLLCGKRILRLERYPCKRDALARSSRRKFFVGARSEEHTSELQSLAYLV